jgi:MFS superfamily sulfate permease-like transporter
MVVMVQSAATTRAFPPDPDSPPDIDRDFVGVGLGNVLAGLAGAFAVNASPPRTAVAADAGARSKRTGIVAAISVGLLAGFGPGLLRHVPSAALAGILLFVAMRIVQVRVAWAVWSESRTEFSLILVTALAIVLLPIETGVGIGILLSLLHGMWTTTRAQVVALGRVPGTTVWWPRAGTMAAQEIPGALVLGFQAPLSFLNAEAFRHGFLHEIDRREPLRLVVLEASGIVEIDFTAAHMLAAIVRTCRERKIGFALARLGSVRAQQSFERFGLIDLIGNSFVYRSAQEAVDALAPTAGTPGF